MVLKEDLREAVSNSRRLALRNYYAAYTLAVCSALGSVAAAILAASGVAEKGVIAVLAAVPAAVLAANAVMKFDSKSSWHWRKKKRLKALLRALEYENATEADIAAKWTQIDADMERDFHPFGGLTAPPGRGD
jgi:hypothetical protein